MIIGIHGYQLYTWAPNKSEDRLSQYKFNYRFLRPEHTYVTIQTLLGKDKPGGSLALVYRLLLEEAKKGKISIIYESPLAVNTVPAHGREPRNSLIVFEVNGNYQGDSE